MRVTKTGGSSGESFAKPKATATRAPTKSGTEEGGSAKVGLPPKTELSLPSVPEDPVSDIADVTILIHGETKIGKTSLVAQFEDPLFLFTEPGGRGLRLKKVNVNSWAELKGYITLIRRSDEHRTIVLDTVQLAYQMCHKHVCKEMGVDHPSEGNFGDVWSAIEMQFVDEMIRLLNSGRGVVFISHSEVVSFQGRAGGEYNKVVPAMNKNARAFMKEKCDVIAYYGYMGKDRHLTVRGSDELEAGHRMGEQFRSLDGSRVHSIPMFDPTGVNGDFGEEEAYQNLVRAFNNQQPDSGEPETLRTVLADTKVIKPARGGRR